MTNLVDKISDTYKFLNVLTWKKLIQLLAFVCIMGLTWALYENREVIYGFASQKRIDTASTLSRDLSKVSKVHINAVAEKSEIIAGIAIMVADFQKNQRILVYSYFPDSQVDLKKIYATYAATYLGDPPLFSDNVEDNKKLVALINGEFVCIPYEKTLSQRLAPSTGEFIKYSCANGIPASYGRFTGIITLYLTREPKTDEIEQLRLVTKTLSTLIYEKDLNR